MKYQLPKMIKKYSFFCLKRIERTNHNKCLNICCLVDNNLNCWKENVIKSLHEECNAKNENNAEYYIKCPNCKSKKIVSIAPYTYICNDCKQNFQIDEYKIREYLEDEYQEIDEDELNYMIQKACKSTK